MSSPFTSTLTAAEVAQKGYEYAQILRRKRHGPAQIVVFLDGLADRAIELQGAGTREDAIAAFKLSTSAEAAAAIAALV